MGKQRVGQRAADLTPEKLRFIQKGREVFCLPARKGICTAAWLRAGVCAGVRMEMAPRHIDKRKLSNYWTITFCKYQYTVGLYIQLRWKKVSV